MESLAIILNRPRGTAAGTAMPMRRRLRTATALGLAALALAGCHGGGSQPSAGNRLTVAGIQFSPNAEPLSGGPLGHPKCEEALSAWFDRTDANHDGAIDREEFLADARRQFDRMDRHHAGYVTSADLSAFRAPYESPPEPDQRSDALSSEDSGRRRPGGIPGGGMGSGSGNGGRGSPQRGPSVDTRDDPVMSADKSLSFKVTLEDFIAQANDLFNGLDRNHDGRVTRDAVLEGCKSGLK
jgi:Ca2+-binding EF-hand superfamily protein